MAIVKMIGQADGTEIIFQKDSSGHWTAAIPKDLDGEYVVEIRAIDEAGNEAYASTMLFIVDSTLLGVKMIPLKYSNRLLEENYEEKSIVSDYVYYATNSDYKFKVKPDKFTFRVVS